MTFPPTAERPLSDVFRDLLQAASTLIRQEIALARAEFTEGASGMARDVVWLGVGVILANVAVLLAASALILALVRMGLTAWIATGVVALLLGAAAGVIVQTRLSAMKQRQLTPVGTVDSVKETAQWL